jgi:hypothetical protein
MNGSRKSRWEVRSRQGGQEVHHGPPGRPWESLGALLKPTDEAGVREPAKLFEAGIVERQTRAMAGGPKTWGACWTGGQG